MHIKYLMQMKYMNQLTALKIIHNNKINNNAIINT